MPVIGLAWRNVWRARARSALTAGAVALAVAFSLVGLALFWAFMNGIFATTTAKVGHLVVRVAGYEEKGPSERLIAEDLKARVEALLPGAEVEGVLGYPVLAAGKNRSSGALLLGVEPNKRNDRELIRRYLARGRGLRPGAAVLGAGLAKKLKLKVGDALYVFAPGALGLGSGLLPVAGVVSLPEAGLDRRFVAGDLKSVQTIAAPGMIERVEVTFPDVRRYADQARIEAAKSRLAAALGPGYEVLRWDEAYPGLATLLPVSRTWFLLFLAIFFFLAGLLLLNTVYLTLVERIRELGVIAALGADRWRLMALVYLETLFLTLVGALAGLLAGGGVVARLARGFSLPGAEDYAQFGIPERLYAEVHAGDVFLTLAFAALTAFFAALWPAWLAGRLEPVRAMRKAPS